MRTFIPVLILAAALGGAHAARAEDARDAPASPSASAFPSVEAGPVVVVRRGYELKLGPWTFRFTAPAGLDLHDLGDRLRGRRPLLVDHSPLLRVFLLTLSASARSRSTRRLRCGRCVR